MSLLKNIKLKLRNIHNIFLKNELSLHFRRFIIIGIISNIINFFIYLIIIGFFNSLFVGSVLGYISGLLFSFHFGRTWVFNNHYKNEYTIKIKFILIYLFGLILMSSIIEFLTNKFLIDYRISWLCAALIVFLSNFVGSKWIVFKKVLYKL